MTAQNLDVATVLERLERLERQNCWMKRVGAGLLLLVGATALAGAQGPAKDKASEPVVLRDERGNERIWMGLSDSGPAVRFSDDKGKERLWLGVVQDSPGLVLRDGSGRRQAVLGTGKGSVYLVLYDEKEKPRGWLVLSPETSALHLMGGEGQRHAGASLEGDGAAVWYHDKEGKVQSGQNALKNVAGAMLQPDLGPLTPPRK